MPAAIRPSRTCPRRGLLAAALGLACLPTGLLAAAAANAAPGLSFRGTAYVHRWSKGGQHEFTPHGEPDLQAWRDMITLNLHDPVGDGEQLAAVANKVLSNYQRHGKILQARSTPRSAARAAEHLIVAVLGTPQLLEATFARCVLHEGTGLIAVVSHRVYGRSAGAEMGQWLQASGPATEQALMAWAPLPSVAQLRRLPSA